MHLYFTLEFSVLPDELPAMCGGFAAALCPDGYYCKYPLGSTGGTCVPDDDILPFPVF